MAKPWEEYQKQKKQEEKVPDRGPWDDYKNQDDVEDQKVTPYEPPRDQLAERRVQQSGRGSQFVIGQGYSPKPIDASTADFNASLLRSAAEGHTMGLSEPLVSGTKAGYSSLVEGVPFSKAYEEDVAARKKFKKENPGADISAQMAGGIIPSPLNVGTKIVGGIIKTGKYLSKIPGLIQVAEKTPGLIKSATKGAATGAAMSGVYQGSQALGGFNEFDPENLKTSAEIGGAFGAAPYVFEGGKRLASWGGKKLFTIITRRPENLPSQYVKNYEKIKTAKTLPEIKEGLDSIVNKIEDDIKTSKLSRDSAKQAYDQIKKDIAFKIREDQAQKALGEKEAKIAAKEAKNLAKELLDSAYNQRLEETSIKIQDSLEKLKSKMVEGSKAATELLSGTKSVISKNDLFSIIDDASSLHRVGGVPVSTEAKKAIGRLDALKKDIGSIGGKEKQISLDQAKAILKQIDQDIDIPVMSGSFSKATSSALSRFRSSLDEILKTVSPEYKSAMEPVAKQAGLLSEASQAFGTPQKATTTLRGIENPQYATQRGLLKELGGQSGEDYLKSISKQNLPEYQGLLSSEDELSRVMAPKLKEPPVDINAMAQATPEFQQLQQAEGKLSSALAAKEPIKGISQATTQSLIESGGRGKIEALRKLKAISKLSDTDFIDEIRKMRIAEGFSGGQPNGSRLAVLGGSVGGAVGGFLAGPYGAAGGGGFGASLGATLDMYGPAITKKILDGYIKFNNMPLTQWIYKIDIPPAVKREILASPIRNLGGSNGQGNDIQ